MTKRDVKERIMSKVSINSNGCWIYDGAYRGEYKVMKVDGRNQSVHREAYKAFLGPIPEGICVCHRCDDPHCCNPAHLFLGTHQDNMRDKIRKGRGNQALTAQQVIDIRKDTRKQREIAVEYNIGRSTVAKLKRGFTYKAIG